MNCRGLIEQFLYDYHAGKLGFWRGLDFRIHLGLCGACRRYVRAYKATVILAKGVMEEEPPKELVEVILKKVMAEGRRDE